MVSADVKLHVYLHTLNLIIITVIDLWLNSSTCTTSANAAVQPQNSGRRHSMVQLQRPGLTIVRTEAYVPRLILIVFAPYLQKPISTSAAVNAVNNTRSLIPAGLGREQRDCICVTSRLPFQPATCIPLGGVLMAPLMNH